ncbi:MAG TPA: MFS transporter [Rhizomicrobium sp.]|nr:MFS transporter [Rhizomicrobium sp.]
MIAVRNRVVAFTMALAAVTYLDRVCISILAPKISTELGLSRVEMGYVFSAFAVAYAAFGVPAAWWADRDGARRVLTRVVLWWSLFTMATAGAWNFLSMVVIRFLFGMGEAGAWPSVARVYSRWIPAGERGRIQGAFFACAHLFGGLTPLVVTAIAGWLQWRAIFIVFGLVSTVWAAGWYVWFRDEPRDHPSVPAEERDHIEATRGLPAGKAQGSWMAVFKTPTVAPLCVQAFANSYGFYFFITWLPTYLGQAHGMKGAELALFSGLPLMLSFVADLTGGEGSDRLAHIMPLRAARRAFGVGGYVLAAVATFLATQLGSGIAAGLLIAIGGACSMLTLAPAWASAVDVGGRHAGVTAGVMNTVGQVGGILSPIVLAYLVDATNDWNAPLLVLAGIYAVAAIAWLMVNPEQRVES